MLNRSTRRLVVSIDEIRSHSRELADGLLNQPFDYSQAFDRALKNIVNTLGNRPAFETAEETVSWIKYNGNNVRTNVAFRCITAHISAVSASSHATLALSLHTTSTTWCLWKAS
jgi:DNA replicative helicase MCM subunit Mcm2 (Cdc46/Mcm family)